MIVYQDKKMKIEINSKNEFYENSNAFNLAKQYDVTRIINKITPIKSFFNNEKFYNYLQSKYYKFTTTDNLNKEVLTNIINANCIPVTITVTNLKNNKSKTYNDVRYTDRLVKTIELFNQIAWYVNKLANYNIDNYKDMAQQKKYSQDFYKQFLLQAFRINQRALTSTNQNDKLLKRTELFIKFIKNSIVFDEAHLYGDTITSIKQLPNLTDLECQVIQNFMSYCENIIYDNDLNF